MERALDEAPAVAVRKVALRTTMVLGDYPNSVFPVLRRLARLGLGGRMGSGRQYVSWMHESDFCRAVEWIVRHEEIRDPVNLCAPNPLPNAEMMWWFREVCGLPFGLPASEWMLGVGAFLLRTETGLIIKAGVWCRGNCSRRDFNFNFQKCGKR